MRQGSPSTPLFARLRPWIGALAVMVLVLTGCQPPANVSQPRAAVGQFGLDVATLTSALADKPTRNWQDGLLNYPALKDAQRSKLQRHVLGTGTVPWAYNLGTPSSNVPAYSKVNVQNTGPNPVAGDQLYTLSDNGTVYKFNPSTGAAPATSPAGALPGTYTKSAIVASGDGKRLYATSANGDFTVLDASTLTRLWSASISTKGFSGTAPFIDYGQNTSGGTTVFGSVEHVYAFATDGSIYHLLVDASSGTLSVTVNACPTSTGSDVGSPKASWTTNNTLSLPAAVSIGGFPVAWKGHIYYGGAGNSATTGMFYDIDVTNLNAPVVANSWNLALYTTATAAGRAITAPAALDYDPTTLAVTTIFVSCGDRVDWIDPIANTVTPSASLTLDHAAAVGSPATAANPTFGPLSGAIPVSNSVTNANPDWVSIKNIQLPNPSRWGGPLPTLGGNVAATSVRIDGSGNIWVCNFSSSNVTIYHANGSAPTVVNVSANPTKLEFDGQGNCWVSCSGFASNGGSGFVEKILANGAKVTGGNFPVVFKGAVYIAPDANGYCWVTDPFGGRIQCIQPNGAFAFSAAISMSTAAAVFVDPTNIAWVSAYGGSTVSRYQLPAGPYPKAAPAALTSTNVGGSTPFGIAFRTSVSPPEAWICLNGSNKLGIMNMSTGAFIKTLPASGTGPTNPWTIRFDSAGNPWTANTTLSSTTTQNVTQLNLSGNVVGSPYSMSAYGNPYELVFDSTDTAYVACSSTNFSTGALVNIPNIGNTGDIFATSYRGTPGDGDDSYGYLNFPVAVGTWANKPVVKSTLKLTQANTPNGGTDDLDFFQASPFQAGTTTGWVGYNGTPNVDYNNRPAVTSPPFFSASGVNPGLNNPYTINVPQPADQKNVPADNTNCHLTYAVRTTNKSLRNAIHWYSATTNGGTTGYLPTLSVAVDTYAQLSTTNGIQCQPSIDSSTHRVYVAASNALFQLDYSSAASYQSTSNTFYNFTQGGGPTGYGPINTGSKTYLNPLGNVLLTLGGRVVIPDVNPSTSQLYLNNFDTTLAPTSNRLVTTLDLATAPASGKGSIGPQMLYDYELGSAYVVTSNNYVIRAQVMQ